MDNKTSLGLAGEKIVRNYLTSQGHQVLDSVDPYDSTKDLKVDGKTLEVKTQVPFVFKRSFTVKPNQLKKCLNVDSLIFVQAPCDKWEQCAIYQIKKGFSYSNYTTKDGTEMILIPMKDKTVVKLVEFKKQSEQYRTLKKYRTNF